MARAAASPTATNAVASKVKYLDSLSIYFRKNFFFLSVFSLLRKIRIRLKVNKTSVLAKILVLKNDPEVLRGPKFGFLKILENPNDSTIRSEIMYGNITDQASSFKCLESIFTYKNLPTLGLHPT
jgi:hypothetical protein